MIKITLPDNSVREYSKGITGAEIASSISPRLAKEVLSLTVNGEIWDLTRPIEEDSSIRLHKFEDNEGKHAFWHSSAHLMAEAIEVFYPGTKFGIGPTVDTGFYYDVDLPDGKVLSEKDLQKDKAVDTVSDLLSLVKKNKSKIEENSDNNDVEKLELAMTNFVDRNKTEKSFLKYIKVRQEEHAEMMAAKWKEIYK